MLAKARLTGGQGQALNWVHAGNVLVVVLLWRVMLRRGCDVSEPAVRWRWPAQGKAEACMVGVLVADGQHRHEATQTLCIAGSLRGDPTQSSCLRTNAFACARQRAVCVSRTE